MGQLVTRLLVASALALAGTGATLTAEAPTSDSLGHVAPLAPAPAKADIPEWFVQVWFDEGLPAEAAEGADPGRVEVTVGGRFAACQTASVYRDAQGRIFLVATALGSVVRGERSEIRVDTYGELAKLSKPRVKINEMPKVLVP